jgi:hypothetical protein
MGSVLFFDTRSVFGPEKIERLAAAFHEVLGSMSDADFASIPALTIRRMVAASIIAEARSGETDPARLKAAALASLSMSAASANAVQRQARHE